MAYIKLFYELNFCDYIRERKQSITRKIRSELDDYILNCNETEYKHHLYDVFKIDPLDILVDQVTATENEKMIPAEKHPTHTYNVTAGRSYERLTITFHIPFSGDPVLLEMKPNPCLEWTKRLQRTENTIQYEIIVFTQTPKQVDREFNNFIEAVQSQSMHLNKQIEDYNDNLSSYIEGEFSYRKQSILERKNFVNNLAVPIQRSTDTLPTFSIPTTVRKKITPKPVVTESGYEPEPTIDLEVYHGILQVIHDTGVMFERLPSTYYQKGEEDLRDHILLNLEPRFEGEVGGETFNKTGKTDILLRYQGENVFIGECKIWRGKIVFLDTITQLLGYLTWRDSKAAVIMFVKQQNISKVIQTVENEISTHPNYLGFVNKQNDSWYNYRFHINGDKNREVKLAVMLYHMPDKE